MDAQAFWSVIVNYNERTGEIQIILFIFMILAIILSYMQKLNWIAKSALGVANLFIGIVFFSLCGTEPIQKFFALPLYLICGILFVWESWKYKNDILEPPTLIQAILLLLYLSYPVISMLLGNSFPKMVTYIMPCPVISLSIAVYSGYKRKSKTLLVLLAIWGLTGIKSIIFNVYEDMILLICGLYATVLLVQEVWRSKAA